MLCKQGALKCACVVRLALLCFCHHHTLARPLIQGGPFSPRMKMRDMLNRAVPDDPQTWEQEINVNCCITQFCHCSLCSTTLAIADQYRDQTVLWHEVSPSPILSPFMSNFSWGRLVNKDLFVGCYMSPTPTPRPISCLENFLWA